MFPSSSLDSGYDVAATSSSSSGSPAPYRAMPFSIDRAAQPKKGTKRPFLRAADILLGPERRYVMPPRVVAAKLGGKVPLIGVDIETHDWTPRRTIDQMGSIGQSGFYNMLALQHR